LTAGKNFDPDIQVRSILTMKTFQKRYFLWLRAKTFQDGSGWTPLMIAVSLKDGEQLVDLLLRKEADVNAKSKLSMHTLDFTVILIHL